MVLLGGPAERDAAAAIVEAIPARWRNRVFISNQPSIQRSAAVLRHCQYCVGNDTGALNMAAAVGIPTLGLFGASPPLTHDPLLHALSGQGMDNIDVNAVLASLDQLVAECLALSAPGGAT